MSRVIERRRPGEQVVVGRVVGAVFSADGLVADRPPRVRPSLAADVAAGDRVDPDRGRERSMSARRMGPNLVHSIGLVQFARHELGTGSSTQRRGCPLRPLAGAIAPSSPTEKRAMDLLMLTTPIVVMIGLLALMQRIETRMTEKAPVRISTNKALGGAHVAKARREEPSTFLATAPLALLVIAAVLAASAVVRMAS